MLRFQGVVQGQVPLFRIGFEFGHIRMILDDLEVSAHAVRVIVEVVGAPRRRRLRAQPIFLDDQPHGVLHKRQVSHGLVLMRWK